MALSPSTHSPSAYNDYPRAIPDHNPFRIVPCLPKRIVGGRGEDVRKAGVAQYSSAVTRDLVIQRETTMLFYNPPHLLSLVHYYSKLSACVLTSVSSLDHPKTSPPALASFLVWSSTS